MDKQRALRKGRPNSWIVIPIRNEEIKQNLIKVREELENQYKTSKSLIRKAFIDLDKELHMYENININILFKNYNLIS